MFYVGTAGWSYPSGKGRWDGVFYPETMDDREKLGFYAQYFDTVEINNSFYRPPSPAISRSWAARVPDRFRFTAKVWQKFTHPKMYVAATGQVAAVQEDDYVLFARGLAPLLEAGKLGALLAQFPPSFKADPSTTDYLVDLVRRLSQDGFHLAVELRHRSWSDPGDDARSIRALFDEEGVAWAMIDEPKFSSSIGDVPLTNRLGYFRFHGRNAAQWWHHEAAEDRYNYLYSQAEQTQLGDRVRQVGERTMDTFAFYNNHYRAKAVVNALELKAALGQPVEAVLPSTMYVEYPRLDQVHAAGARSLDAQTALLEAPRGV